MNSRIPSYYKYLILFRGETVDIDPVISVTNISQMRAMNHGKMHLFDEELLPIIPAVEYCLHLPRTEMDTYDTAAEILDCAHDVSHDIYIVPDSVPFLIQLMSDVTLIIYADNCKEEIIALVEMCNAELGAVCVTALSQSLLVNQWNSLFESRACKDGEIIKDIDKQYILDGDKQLVLPILFLARQYELVDHCYRMIFNTANEFEICANLLWNQLIHHNALMSCKGVLGTNANAFRKQYKEGENIARKTTRINIVITMPGIPVRQEKIGGLSQEVPHYEKRVIRLLGLHRAIAKNALLIEMPPASRALFDKLNELELYCAQGTNNKYVKRTLRDIGRMIEKALTKEQLWAVNWSKHITIFSDFPIGLAIIGDADTPLQCYKEISYRPLSPLTRCFQNEVLKHRQIHCGPFLKIAFAECIPNDRRNRRIRYTSDAIVNSLKNTCKDNSRICFVYGETLTIRDFKEFLDANKDADILHVSGHGSYDRRLNVAGLMVGEELWMANDNDYTVPPVVILSACHVSPRGSGAVSVADLFVRAGAEAVLGTLIPVDAQRNTILINRLYTYISEALKGSRQYKTLAEAWSGIVATNAVYEMAETSKRFFEWIWGKGSNGKVRMIDFTTERSVGRLHGESMYKDTTTVIKEMLLEEGKEGKFDDILSQEDYFPESFFYQWIGFPENVFLYDEVFEKIKEF